MEFGISVLIAIKAAVLFMLFVGLKRFDLLLLSLPFLYASLISVLVSIASHPRINLPMLLGKTPDGKLPFWSLIMFSPYLYLAWNFSLIRRYFINEDPFNEICEGVYVGGWPYSIEVMPPGNPTIIDCTIEFPRRVEFSGNAYLCIPTWDTRSPHPADIESAVKWACRMRAQGRPVFVHCAYGHGRSVAVVCALLVALGVAEDWKSAEKLVRSKRPSISLTQSDCATWHVATQFQRLFFGRSRCCHVSFL